MPSLAEKLASPDPVTISVVGDSTGYEDVQWVNTLAADISAQFGRPVNVSRWSRDTLSYDAPVTYGGGAGTPVTIWNGSAPGESPKYSQLNLAALIPADVSPDQIIVNHGFNTGGNGVADIARLVADIEGDYPRVPLAITLQNPRTSASAEEQVAKYEPQRDWLARNGQFSAIDVYKAYTTSSDKLTLYRDERHPNAAGGRVWADTVRTALGF